MRAELAADDRLEAFDALLRFAVGTDEGDAALIRSAFADGANVDFGPCGDKLGIPFPLLEGCDAIVGFLASTCVYQITSHVVTNLRVAKSPAGVTMRALVEATYIVRKEPSRRFRMLDPYSATLARHEEGWRIERLVIDNIWFEGDPRTMLCRQGGEVMKLEHEFTYQTSVDGPHIVGDGPLGMRHHYDMTDGVIEGRRLNARTVGAAADWMLIGADGFMRMDVRLRLATSDGAVLLARYHGLAEANDRPRAALVAGEATGYDDQCIRTVWQIESRHPRYAWVNQAIFIGEGRVCPSHDGQPGFEHRIYRAA